MDEFAVLTISITRDEWHLVELVTAVFTTLVTRRQAAVVLTASTASDNVTIPELIERSYMQKVLVAGATGYLGISVIVMSTAP